MTTYIPAADPRVLATVDLLTDAVIAASHYGSISGRYMHGAHVTAREVERAHRASMDAQTAAQNAIYDLAAALAADGAAVAS